MDRAPGLLTVGFAGSRRLLPASPENCFVDETSLDRAAGDRLAAVLRRLPGLLGLPWETPVLGVSQVAIGADTLFCRACCSLGHSRSVLLPCDPESYLRGRGADGSPDFSPAQQDTARALLASPKVAGIRTVSSSPGREPAFVETNQAIVAASDVLLCLLRQDAAGRPGGTLDFIRLAHASGKPLCEIRLSFVACHPVFRETLHRFPAAP